MRNRLPSVYWFVLPATVTLLGLGISIPVSAQTASFNDGRRCVPCSAFYFSLGGSYNSVNFGNQDVIAVGTSTITGPGGAIIATGFAEGPDDATGGTPIYMDTQLTFAPSIELGYFSHFRRNDCWLWGAKFTNDYLGTTSNYRLARLPQVGTFTFTPAPTPTPFTGNAIAETAQTQIIDQMAIRPFIGHSFEKGFVYFGGGPTVSLLRTEVIDLVGFADINGNRQDISGAPQDFSDSAWVWGGSAQAGVVYFFDRSWFVDLSYIFAITSNHTFNFSSTYSNTNENGRTNAGTLVGSSTWQAITQSFSFKIGKAF